jgi:hypothetical protein
MGAELKETPLQLAGIGQHRLQAVLQVVADLDRRPDDLADGAPHPGDELVQVEGPGREMGPVAGSDEMA